MFGHIDDCGYFVQRQRQRVTHCQIILLGQRTADDTAARIAALLGGYPFNQISGTTIEGKDSIHIRGADQLERMLLHLTFG